MKQFNRRLFLQGVGGAVVAAPFLGSVVARAQGAAGTPQRLIVFFTHYGCFTKKWFPTKSHGALTAADYEATTLKHLAPYADKLLMPRGIRAMNEWSFTQELGQESDPHSQVMGGFFTCCPSDGWSGLGSKPASVRSDVPIHKLDARPVGVDGTNIGRSLDHIAAEQVSPSGQPLVMHIGGYQMGEMQNFSYSKAGSAGARAEIFAAIGNPSTVYSEITKLFGSGGGAEEATYQVARGKHVLDLVGDDLARMKAVPMSQSDKDKLSAWEQLLTEVTTSVRAECSEGALGSLGITAQELSAAGGDLTAASKAVANIAVLSALCDHNRLIFMKMPGNYRYTFLEGVTGDNHGISHRIGNPNMGGNCVSGVNDMIVQMDDWYAQQFAYLVGQLDKIPEGEGKLLDNTATIWFQEMSDGNSHNLNNMPILQAGSCGGYFKVGQAINVDDGSADLPVGNSDAACEDGGTVSQQQLDGTGTPKEFANAPINKYFCNLLNAIGVKADESGFPAIGGTQPVSSFGMYDNTKDFATFLTNNIAPPKINDPGEFEELKA